ncbi:hypothetical protein SAMN05216388_101365 [Halorientalis persicus]|uniref:C2H2-type domain-containing protein n=1 Tax=Halorientalis persicus TaxID=1367881 RepID=A0A1H8Q4Z1_9EURY|nr:hypothetical protein [Halorientalis persicus]SEO49299.1 hypothetical protein SAMN05216388_101365 [Halorientalis persicus]
MSTSTSTSRSKIRCFGCRDLFDTLEEYQRHSKCADCMLTGETWVTVEEELEL